MSQTGVSSTDSALAQLGLTESSFQDVIFSKREQDIGKLRGAQQAGEGRAKGRG